MTASHPILMSDDMVRALLAGDKSETRRIWSDRYANLAPGTMLWVKESWRCRRYANGEAMIEWRSDNRSRPIALPQNHMLSLSPDPHRNAPWKSVMFMPKAFSRITLRVTGTVRSRLQAIDGTDCLQEGMRGNDLINRFHALWDKLHDKTGERWADDPAVAIIRFDVVQDNVDQLRRVA